MLQSQRTAHHKQYSVEVDLRSKELSSRRYTLTICRYVRIEEQKRRRSLVKEGSIIWRPARGARNGPRIDTEGIEISDQHVRPERVQQHP
jgi:hypothetical protein